MTTAAETRFAPRDRSSVSDGTKPTRQTIKQTVDHMVSRVPIQTVAARRAAAKFANWRKKNRKNPQISLDSFLGNPSQRAHRRLCSAFCAVLQASIPSSDPALEHPGDRA
jgi:hypothetical protein